METMASNGLNPADDADMAECDGEKVVTMVDVLQEQQEFEEDANAVLGASDDKNCTYPKGYIKRQAIYACLTCCSEAKSDPSKRAGVCLACSLTCHENHELVELYTKRNFRCDCGNPKFNSHPCQFIPNKIDTNDENKYNQNFSGVYCICHRPYPDPESPVEDQMIQCIICEDWYHASHLAATVPPNDQYSEMICQTCMKKNEFLHDYSSLAVNIEDTDVVVDNDITDIMITDSTTVNSKDSTEDKLVNDSMEVQTDIPNEETNEITLEVQTEIPNQEETKENTEVQTEIPNGEETKENTDVKIPETKTEISEDIDSTEIKANDIAEKTDSITSQDETSTNINIPMESDSLEDTIKEVQQEIDSSNIQDGKPQETSESINTSKESVTESKSEEQNTSEVPGSAVVVEPESNTLNIAEEEENPNISNELSSKSPENIVEPENSKSVIDSINKEITKEEEESNNESKGEKEVSVENEILSEKMSETNENKTNIENNIIVKQSDLQTTEEKNEENLQQEGAQHSDNKNIDSEESNIKNDNSNTTADSTPIEKDEQIINSSNEDTDIAKNEFTETEQPSSDESKLNEIETINTESSTGEADKISKDNEIVENNGTEKEDTKSQEALDSTSTSDIKQDTVLNNRNNESQDINNENEDVEMNEEEASANESSSMKNNIANETENTQQIELNSKRKLSTGEPIEESVLKKPKLDDTKNCVRPRNVKKIYKGATFWPSDFRQKLCTCNECICMYKDLAVLFLIDPEDTVQAYETLGKERINGTPATQYEKGLEALSSLDRIQQINALTEYNKMRDKLLDFLKSFKDRKEIVKEEDIKAFFAGMKPKREPDGVYFCR